MPPKKKNNKTTDLCKPLVTRLTSSRLWEEADLQMDADLCTRLVIDTTHNEEVIREAGALALANALADNPDYVPAVLQQLITVYEEKLYVSRFHLSINLATIKVTLMSLSVSYLYLPIHQPHRIRTDKN